MRENKIKVGSKVRHNNLVCRVVALNNKFCELEPLGSSNTRYSAKLEDVSLIMNEGSFNNNVDTSLFS